MWKVVFDPLKPPTIRVLFVCLRLFMVTRVRKFSLNVNNVKIYTGIQFLKCLLRRFSYFHLN